MEPVKIQRKKTPFYRQMISSPIVVVISTLWMLDLHEKGGDYKWIWIALLSVFTFMSLALFANAVKQITQKTAGLIIDDQGITDNVSYAAPGLIPWGNIRSWSVANVNAGQHLVIELVDDTEVMNAHKGVKKKILESLVSKVHTPIAIHLKLLEDRAIDEISSVNRMNDLLKFNSEEE